MSEELEPCPFCGGTARLLKGGPGNCFVRCDNCSAGSDDGSEEHVAAAWNRRAPSPDMREAMEALEEYAREATKAITGLVGGGPELFGKQIGDLYTADLEYCVARIRSRFADGHEAKVALAKAETNLRHWREECGKLHAQGRSLTGAKP